MFNAVFVATLNSFNKCFFFVSAGFDVVALIFLGYVILSYLVRGLRVGVAFIFLGASVQSS